MTVRGGRKLCCRALTFVVHPQNRLVLCPIDEGECSVGRLESGRPLEL